MSDYLIQQLINTLTLGSLYAIVAVGFSLIYGVIRLVNFAHGDLMMIGAFTTLALLQSLSEYWLVIPFMILAYGFFIGCVLERIAFRPIRGAPMITGFVITLSLSIMIQNLGLIFYGAQPTSFRLPDFFSQPVAIGDFTIPMIDLVIPVTVFTLAILLIQFIRHHRLGIAMRAVSENLLAAQLMGISVKHTVLVAVGLGSALACLAGFLWGGKFGQIDPMMGLTPGLKAFIATIIGGVGSISGAIAGGFILAIAEILIIGLLPPEYASYRAGFVFGTLIIILLIRPQGLFGQDEEERA